MWGAESGGWGQCQDLGDTDGVWGALLGLGDMVGYSQGFGVTVMGLF